jgi:hypothetical protein
MNSALTNFATFAAAFAVALTVASSAPALAKSRTAQAGHAAHAQVLNGVIAQDGVSRDRAQALRSCNDVAASFKEYTWGGNTPSQVYRSCMTQHGQPE